MKKTAFLLTLLTLLTTYAKGQDTLVVSREDLKTKLFEENHQAKLAALQVQMANADYQQSNSLYLPQVSASYTAITTNNPLMAFGSKLNQEILTQADFNPALLNNPDNIQNYATELLILQPLLNLDGIHGRTAARIQKEAYQLKSDRTKEYLELELAKRYMQLQLAYEAVDVLNRAYSTSIQALGMVQDYYDQGLLQKADLLDVKVRSNEVASQLSFAKSNIQNASDELAVFIGETPGTVTYRPAERAPLNYEQVSFPILLPDGRKDLMAMEKSVEGYQRMLMSSKSKFLPRINAFGSFQIYDNQAVGFGASGYVLGAKLSWDLFNGYTNLAKTSKAKLEVEKSRVEREQYSRQQQSELNKTNRTLSDIEQKVQLSKQAFEQSSEAYKTRKDRFEQGMEKTADLLMSETQMFSKELEYRQAVFEYNFTKEYLRFLTRA